MTLTRRALFGLWPAGALAAVPKPTEKPKLPDPIVVPEHVESQTILTTRFMNQLVDGLARTNEILKYHGLIGESTPAKIEPLDRRPWHCGREVYGTGSNGRSLK